MNKMGSRVFIGGLTYRVRERDVYGFFRKYGRVKEVSMKSGFAFVEFDDYRDAEDAISELNGKELLGERVSVEKARGTPHGSDRWLVSGGGKNYERENNRDKHCPLNRTNHRLIVENLSSSVNWKDLKDHMRAAGFATYANAHNRRRNEGVVEFASSSDMKNAIHMFDNTEINGRQIRLVEDCGGRGGGGGGRYRSRSRSHSRPSKSQSRSRSRQRSRSSSHSRSRDRSRARSCSH